MSNDQRTDKATCTCGAPRGSDHGILCPVGHSDDSDDRRPSEAQKCRFCGEEEPTPGGMCGTGGRHGNADFERASADATPTTIEAVDIDDKRARAWLRIEGLRSEHRAATLALYFAELRVEEAKEWGAIVAAQRKSAYERGREAGRAEEAQRRESPIPRVSPQEWATLVETQKRTIEIQADRYETLQRVAMKVVRKYCSSAAPTDPDVVTLAALANPDWLKGSPSSGDPKGGK